MSSALIWAVAAVLITALLAAAASRAWAAWLSLKRLELARGGDAPELPPAVRIEMAALKERLRRLEAIAQGVDL